MNDLSSIFASPHTDNFQNLMRKNFKKGNKELTQISFVELETGHYDLHKIWSIDNPMNLDVEPKYIKDFNIVGFDIEVYTADHPGTEGPTLIVMGAGTVSDATLEFLQNYNDSDDESWVGQLCDALAQRGTTQEVLSIYESLVGDFVIFIFKDGELFVFSDGKQLRADNRLTISATALAFSTAYQQRSLFKIDPNTEKLYPVLTL